MFTSCKANRSLSTAPTQMGKMRSPATSLSKTMRTDPSLGMCGRSDGRGPTSYLTSSPLGARTMTS